MPTVLQVCCTPAAWGQRHAHLPRLLSSVSAIVICGIPPGNCLDWKTKSEAQGPHQCLLSPTQWGLRSRVQRYKGLTVDPGQYLPQLSLSAPCPQHPLLPGQALPPLGPRLVQWVHPPSSVIFIRKFCPGLSKGEGSWPPAVSPEKLRSPFLCKVQMIG